MPRALTLVMAAVGAMALLPGVAAAQGTEEQQQACTPDALKLCSDTIPDIGKTTACMKAHYGQLSPRCQTAFHDATGGGTKAASHKTVAVAPRASRSAAHAEHQQADSRAHERRAGERHPGEAAEREAPPAREAEAAEPRAVEGYPPFPSADTAPARSANARSQIANACRAGLIDSFTCSTTVPALLGAGAE